MELYCPSPPIAPNRLILQNLSRREPKKTIWRGGCYFPWHRANSQKGEMKYMSDFQESANTTPRWVALAVAVLGGVSLLGLGVSWRSEERRVGKSVDLGG